MNKLRRLVVALAATALLAGTAAPAAAAPTSPRVAERSTSLWSSSYLMGTVRDWPCASTGTRTCGVYSRIKQAHYLVTFDRSGDVSDIRPRRASVRDA